LEVNREQLEDGVSQSVDVCGKSVMSGEQIGEMVIQIAQEAEYSLIVPVHGFWRSQQLQQVKQ